MFFHRFERGTEGASVIVKAADIKDRPLCSSLSLIKTTDQSQSCYKSADTEFSYGPTER
jgi:hypothetical protein